VDLPLTKALFEQGLIDERRVVDAAVGALELGHDSPSLRLLAGLTPVELDQTRELLTKAAEELALPDRDEVDSVLVAARWLAGEAIAGRHDVAAAIGWIAHHTWFAYEHSERFEEEAARRPPEIQRLIDQVELDRLLMESDHVPDVFPAWLRDRLLADAEAVLRALAEGSAWPEPAAFQDVEWTGREYRLRSSRS
jgi:hypothetical protein